MAEVCMFIHVTYKLPWLCSLFKIDSCEKENFSCLSTVRVRLKVILRVRQRQTDVVFIFLNLLLSHASNSCALKPSISRATFPKPFIFLGRVEETGSPLSVCPFLSVMETPSEPPPSELVSELPQEAVDNPAIPPVPTFIIESSQDDLLDPDKLKEL